ncbi:MAG: hypothetical protein ABIJ91_04985 [Candidatus Kuenenbacteria bacterium]
MAIIALILFIIASPFVFAPDFSIERNSAQAAFNFSKSLDDIASEAGLKTGSEETSLTVIIGGIIYSALGLVGVLFLLLIIIAGLRWMMAGGNEETVAKAKSAIINAAVGVLIILSAYAITFFVINVLV